MDFRVSHPKVVQKSTKKASKSHRTPHENIRKNHLIKISFCKIHD